MNTLFHYFGMSIDVAKYTFGEFLEETGKHALNHIYSLMVFNLLENVNKRQSVSRSGKSPLNVAEMRWPRSEKG